MRKRVRSDPAGHAVACAALLGLWCLPAHAFISLHFTPWDLLVIGLYFAWPYLLPVLVVSLALMWSRRHEWRIAFRSVLAVALAGTAVLLVYWVPQWMSDHRARAEREFWERVDNAAAMGKVDEAVRLLDGRGAGAMQQYVSRFADGQARTQNDGLLKIAFGRCADLLAGGILDIDLLDQAIEHGHTSLIEAWLKSPACPRPDGLTRGQRLAEIVYHLLPFTSSGYEEPAERPRRAGQAAALRVLMAHHPALLDVDVSTFGCTRYRGAYAKCTVLGQLLDTWHGAGMAAVLPLDPRAGEHLPAVALHLLRGDEARAAEAARADPVLFHRLLPALVATMPLEGLRAALKAAPPPEAALLSPQGGETLFQHLSALFDAARRRDTGEDDWPFLALVFELFPTRLSEIDHGLFEGYLIGTEVRDARVSKMLTTLRAARMPCEQLTRLTGWGSNAPQALDWYAEVTGCEKAPP